MEEKHLNDLPQRDITHDIEKASFNAFENAIAEAGLFITQKPDKSDDYGSDLQIEARIGSSVTNSRVHVQLKGTSTEANKDGSISISIKRTNLNYLLRQPLSLYVCYHELSKQLLVAFAEDVFRQYEQKDLDWRARKNITVKFSVPFDISFQTRLNDLLVARSNSLVDWRLQWTAATPEQLTKIVNRAKPLVSIPGDPKQAYEILSALYGQGEDEVISASFPQFEAVLGNIPEAISPAYMSEINLGINGYEFDEERVLKSVPLLEGMKEKGVIEPGSLTYCVANAWLALEKYEAASCLYLQALEELPFPEAGFEAAQCFKNLGAAFGAQGKTESAKECYQKALNLVPELPEAKFALAKCLYDEGDDKGALELFDSIVWETDSSARSLSVSGWRTAILFNLGDTGGAFREVNLLLSHASKLKWIFPWCAKHIWQFGKESTDTIQKSVVFWRKYLQEFPEDIRGKREYLICLWRLHECDIRVDMDFLTFKREILALIEAGDPDPAFLWDRLGHWAQTEDSWEEAEDAYRKANEKEPDQYGYCLGTALNFRKKYEEALPILLAQAEEYLPDSKSWFQVAVAREGTGDTVGCIEAYERALELDPDYDLAWFNLGGVCWNSGDTPYALTIWKEAVTRFPDHDLAGQLRQFLPSVFGKEN